MDTTQTWKIGDCFELMQKYPDNYFDLILTDPPYGIGEAHGKNTSRGGRTFFKGKRGKFVPANDYGIATWDDERLDKKYFDEMIRISKNQIIFGGNYYIDYLLPSSCWLVWDKDNSGDFADCELAWTSFKTAIRIFKYRWNGMLQENMKKKEKRVHPTQKPVPLFEWIIKKYSNDGELICDPFLGSGTTLEACMNTNRNCIGFEIDPQWEQIYIKRLKQNNHKLTDYNWSEVK